MRLRRIEVQNFRKLGHIVIQGLEDGLNVVVGDNEAGKSTLLAALRAALFERHRVTGEAAQAMLPYGQAVRPEITLDFDLGGGSWRLRKAFCQKPEAELVGPGERSTGNAVEDRLAELLGFTPSGRGASRPGEHQGVYGLLWVEQGASHRELGVGAGRETLATALEAEVGHVVGGERGRALLAAAEARRGTFWGGQGGARPKGEFKTLLETLDDLGRRREELKAALARHDEKVAALTGARDILGRHERDDTRRRAAEAVHAAQDAAAQVGALQARLSGIAERVGQRRAARDVAAERQRLRLEQIERLRVARALAASAEEEAADSAAALRRAERAASEAAARLAAARAARKACDERVEALEQALSHRQAGSELARLLDRLSAAEGADKARREALGLATAGAVDKKMLARLHALRADLDRVNAQLEAAGARLTFAPEGGRAVLVDGSPHDPAQPLGLSRETRLELEGFGSLIVCPGGTAGDLAAVAETAERALLEALRLAGVAGVAEAEASLQQRLELEREAELQKRLRNSHAPQGMEALREEVERHRALMARARPAAEPLEAASQATLSQARQERRSAAESERSAEEEAAGLARLRETASSASAVRTERAEAARRDLVTRQQELEAARAQRPDEAVVEALAATEAALEASLRDEAAARETVAGADVEGAALELQRAERAERAIAADIDDTARRARDLEVELRALGRDGLGEQLAEVEGLLALRERQAGAKRLEADAAWLLHETLAQAQRESKDRWLGPVRDRVAPYLKLIQPDGEVLLDEHTLEIEGLRRGGVDETFEQLSVGAREQAAVITRLALADILKGAGKPSAIILDDALVNTDEARLARMHLVLQRAARSNQILVLTCRERDFLQLGAPIRRM